MSFMFMLISVGMNLVFLLCMKYCEYHCAAVAAVEAIALAFVALYLKER